MILRILAITMMVLSIAAVSGCEKKSPPPEQTEVKITGENLDTELDKMEQQIDADIAAEQ